jgi:hypothetical protein
MNDKNLRKELAWCRFSEAENITQRTIDSIKAAILKDQEEERNFCAEQVKSKMKPTVENFAGGNVQPQYSPIGKDFDGKTLDENNVHGGVKVLYDGTIYETGNRYHRLVELYLNGKRQANVSTLEIQLCRLT